MKSRALPFLLVLLAATRVLGGENLALGRPYTCSIAPNYKHCTDDGDSRQLTDGLYVDAKHSWTSGATVGWELVDHMIVRVVLDLEEPAEVSSLTLSTRQFAPAEVFPPSVLMATSEDGRYFEWVASIDKLDAPYTEDRTARKIRLHSTWEPKSARYVLCAFLLGHDFLFLDEIEVGGMRRRGTQAAPAIDPLPLPLLAQFEASETAEAFAEIRRLWAVRKALPHYDGVQFPACTPAFEEDRRLAARAFVWRQRQPQSHSLQVSRADPWANTLPWTVPASMQAARQWRGDVLQVPVGHAAAAAFDVANQSEQDRVVAAKLQSVPSGVKAELRWVLAVEARNGLFAGDALPRYFAEYKLRPGALAQLWLDIQVDSGTSGRKTVVVDIHGDPHPVEIQASPAPPPVLRAYNWNYVHKVPMTRACSEEALLDNYRHGINTTFMAEDVVPWPAPNAFHSNGELRERLDFGHHDRVLRFYRDAKPDQMFVFYWDWRFRNEDPSRGRLPFPYASAAWKTALRTWLEAWYQHLGDLGMPLRNVAMMVIDEHGGDRVAELYRMLKEARPSTRLAITLTRGESNEEIRVVTPFLDILIHERRRFDQRQALFDDFQKKGGQIWVYHVPLPSKGQSPIEDFRLLPWFAWSRNADGVGFWGYADVRGLDTGSWQDFDGDPADFSVVYGRMGSPPQVDEELIPSKRWRAFRLGLQDVALFQAAAPSIPGLRRRLRRALESGEGRWQLLAEARESALQ